MKLKEISDRFDLSKSKSYIFKKWVFRTTLLLIVIVAIFGTIESGGLSQVWTKHLYVSCPVESRNACINPVYHNYEYCGKILPDDSVVCTSEFLPPGFAWGVRPGFLVSNFGLFAVCLVGLGFMCNHLLYNRRSKVIQKIRAHIKEANELEENGGEK